MSILYSIGYSNRKALQFLPSLVARGFVVVDVRLTPYSKFPAFQKANLVADYGRQYKHLVALGNVNHHTEDGIQLKDSVAGTRQLAAILATNNVVMFCGCKDVLSCHRYVIANLITRHLPSVTLIEM